MPAIDSSMMSGVSTSPWLKRVSKSSCRAWRIGDLRRGRVATKLGVGACSLATVPILLGMVACSNGSDPTSRGAQPHVQSPGPPVEAAVAELATSIQSILDGHDQALAPLTHPEQTDLQELYQAGSYASLWLDAAGRPTRNASEALGLIDQAADHGLNPSDYRQAFLDDMTARMRAGTSTPPDIARFDVALSSGMLRYLRQLHRGRVDPRAIGFRLTVPADQHDFPALLRAAIAKQQITKTAADVTPPLAQYRALRAMLPRYRAMADDPALVAPPPITKAVHPGDAYDGAGRMYRLLVAFGDLPPDTPVPLESGSYDGASVEGVKHFQIRHGLEPDGVLGMSTVAALRVPLARRVREIELALERLRWLPHLGDERLVALNIPMFRLWTWDVIPPNGVPLFGMDVIVGRALNTQTPVFVEEMREVTFRPYWNVPRSILLHEVLPKLERDPEYLRREDMEIVRGAGDNLQALAVTTETLAGLRQGSLRVRQRPGPKNALGLIKFVFPNEEDVYMHGTPAQALFAKSRRDFSHGCVRVADPVMLAEWVLKDRPEWTRDRILASTAGSQTLHVKLPRPIQVILFYTTAAVMPEDGTIRFAEDIYHHDTRLDRALATRQAGY